MYVTILTGNGFDLSAGLRTSPHAFLTSYINEYASNEADPDSPSCAIQLANQIKADGVKNWSDFESKLGEYSSQLVDPEEYLQACDHLSEYLHEWLTKEQQRITDEFVEKNAQECIGSLIALRTMFQPQENARIEDLRQRHGAEHWNYSIVTFNYTNLLDKMFEFVRSKSPKLGNVDNHGREYRLDKVTHAHETLEGCIITGVNDASQIANESFRNDVDVLRNTIKEQAQRQLGSNSDTSALDAISHASIICIFGMAMGATDRRWWNAVYQRLVKSPETVLIIFSHELGKAEAHTSYKRYSLIKKVRRSFFEGAGIEFDQDLADKIIVAPSRTLFPMTKIAETNEAGSRSEQCEGCPIVEF